MRLVANVLSALIAVACVKGVAWFATGAIGPDGTWFDELGAVACMAGFLGAGALAIPRRWR